MKLVSTLDRLVLEKVRQYDRRQLPVENIAVNISASSLQDLTFRQWVENFLSNLPPSSPRLIFEFAEYGAVQNLEILRDFRTVLEKQGHGIGLDHFGRSFSNLGYLQSLRPDYVKIDRAYTGELKDEENDARFYISSLCRVAHSIDITVIAEGVETEQQYRILRELNLDAAQGYFLKRPRPMEECLT
jgi:EAL domain-containing protein (putative c-di-GMP-specific phosphodiesterase class I)